MILVRLMDLLPLLESSIPVIKLFVMRVRPTFIEHLSGRNTVTVFLVVMQLVV
ncbi:hypothetical protein LOS20_02545 [Enterococcus faecium]|nr:hypothetical protein [Enterococcus faecium]